MRLVVRRPGASGGEGPRGYLTTRRRAAVYDRAPVRGFCSTQAREVIVPRSTSDHLRSRVQHTTPRYVQPERCQGPLFAHGGRVIAGGSAVGPNANRAVWGHAEKGVEEREESDEEGESLDVGSRAMVARAAPRRGESCHHCEE